MFSFRGQIVVIWIENFETLDEHMLCMRRGCTGALRLVIKRDAEVLTNF